LLRSCYLSLLVYTSPANQLYPLSLHDALPISPGDRTARWSARRADAPDTIHAGRRPSAPRSRRAPPRSGGARPARRRRSAWRGRSEEHTSELQSLTNLVCRLLLEKKKHIAANP